MAEQAVDGRLRVRGAAPVLLRMAAEWPCGSVAIFMREPSGMTQYKFTVSSSVLMKRTCRIVAG